MLPDFQPYPLPPRLETNPLGLITFETENAVFGPQSPTYHLDIIAIHGLNGNAITTWTNKCNKLWLQEFLPVSLPGARVHTFGYDSAIFSQSTLDIGDFARSLLTELSLKRESEMDKQRGIVFICHSLGGIVCKKALVLAHESSRYTAILQSTKAIIFFGTPHAGCEKADFLSVLADVVAAAGKVTLVDRAIVKLRKDLVRTLKPRSVELEELAMSFTQRSQGIDIVSFYEGHKMPPFNEVLVPLSSTRIGVPNEELIPIPDNHRDMCRLSDEHTLPYRRIVQEQDCLKALDVIDMDDCRAQLQPHTLGTCEWILSNPQFRQWTSENDSSLLHIIGDMGTGKSILMSYLVEQIGPYMNSSPCFDLRKPIICSFFCDDKDVARKSGQAILRGLLSQILHQRHDLLEHATAKLSPVDPGRWSFLVLWQILRNIMLDPITGTVVIILDAMDECEQSSRNRVLDSIAQFLAQESLPANNCVKFLISSRPNIDIMEKIDQFYRLSLADESGHREIDNAILLVVKDQLDKLAINAPWIKDTKEALEYRIVTKAERNFLWVRLVIQRLRKGPQTKKFFDQVLDESPKDLDGLYCHILADIDEDMQEPARKLLRILVGALRPITIAELRVAAAVELQHRTLDAVEGDRDNDIERTARVALGSLVRVHDNRIHLVHQSAKDFLLRLSTGKVANLKTFEPDLRKLYGISSEAANLELATACVAFLSLADFETQRVLDENVSAFDELPGATEDSPWFLMRQASDAWPGRDRDSPSNIQTALMDQKPVFFEYSACHWTSHLRASGELSTQDLLRSAIHISSRGTNTLSNWADQYRLSSTDLVSLPKDLEPLIVAAFFGLNYLALEILHNHKSGLRENTQSLALSWACRMGYLQIVQALLDQGTPVLETSGRVEGGSPLSWACTNGCLDIVQVLLQKADASQINQRDGNGRTPLSLAVGSGHVDTVKLLLARKDVDVNLKDRNGSTPLLWAFGSESEKQDLTILTCLVSDPRVDITLRDRLGRTVLSWAAGMGASDAVNILINSQRPDVDTLLHDAGDTDRGWSPLSWAAFYGHIDVVKALCMTGKVDVQLASVDKRGQNAVSLAADQNHPEVIKILADIYPQGIDFPEDTGRNPLSCAMWGSPSNAETVRALLQTGLVDVNRRAANGQTPLAYAARAGRADLIRILVEEGGANLDIPDNNGKVPGDEVIDWRFYQVKQEIDRLRGLCSGNGD